MENPNRAYAKFKTLKCHRLFTRKISKVKTSFVSQIPQVLNTLNLELHKEIYKGTPSKQTSADMGTFTHNNETFPRLQFWQIDDTYFENPSSLRNLIRLPKQWLEPMRRMERHFTDAQMNFNLRGNVD